MPASARKRLTAVAAGLSSAPTLSWWLDNAGGTDPSSPEDPPPVPEAADFVVVGGGKHTSKHSAIARDAQGLC